MMRYLAVKCIQIDARNIHQFCSYTYQGIRFWLRHGQATLDQRSLVIGSVEIYPEFGQNSPAFSIPARYKPEPQDRPALPPEPWADQRSVQIAGPRYYIRTKPTCRPRPYSSSTREKVHYSQGWPEEQTWHMFIHGPFFGAGSSLDAKNIQRNSPFFVSHAHSPLLHTPSSRQLTWPKIRPLLALSESGAVFLV